MVNWARLDWFAFAYGSGATIFHFFHDCSLATLAPNHVSWATHWWFNDRFAYAYGSGTTIFQFFHDCSLATLAPDSINWAYFLAISFTTYSFTTKFAATFFHWYDDPFAYWFFASIFQFYP